MLIALFVALPSIYSQVPNYYNEQLSWLYYDDGTLNFGALFLNLLVLWLVLTVVYYFISKLETIKHIKDRIPPQGQKFLYVSFILCLIMRAFLLHSGIWVLIGRAVFAFFISIDAKKLGRNKLLWWVLSFIEPNAALMVLANTPKLIKAKGELKLKIESIFQEYDNKLENLQLLGKSGLLEGIEYKNKKESLDESYHKKIEVAIDLEQRENLKNETNVILEQLKKAYQDGVLTKEEYETKREEVLD